MISLDETYYTGAWYLSPIEEQSKERMSKTWYKGVLPYLWKGTDLVCKRTTTPITESLSFWKPRAMMLTPSNWGLGKRSPLDSARTYHFKSSQIYASNKTAKMFI